MGSRLGVIIRSENGWELYYDLGGVGAQPPLARPSRSGHRLSRRAAPSDVHPTAPNSSALGTSSGPRSRASRSDSRSPLWRCGVEPPLMSYCAFTARNIPGLTGDRRDGARGLGTTRDGSAHPSPSLRRYGWSCRPPGPTRERERIHMDVLLVALRLASAPCSVADDRGEGDTVDHGGVPLESRDPVLDVSRRLGAAGESGDLAAVFERVRQDVMPGRASGGRSGGSKRWSARDFRVRTGSCAHGGWRH